jgi:hypothetical protein
VSVEAMRAELPGHGNLQDWGGCGIPGWAALLMYLARSRDGNEACLPRPGGYFCNIPFLSSPSLIFLSLPSFTHNSARLGGAQGEIHP